MSTQNKQPSRERFVVAALAVVAFVAQTAAFHATRFDDAFITYRYGQNLATGHGLSFNPGEPFLGSTSPGHMFLSALVYACCGQTYTPSVLAAIGCLGWTAQALAVRWLLWPALGALGSAIVAALIAMGAACSYFWVALETNLLAALMLFALCNAREQRWRWTAVLSALACVMRPDAALLAIVLGVVCIRAAGRRALQPALIFAAIVLPWLVFSSSYYGSPLPHSAVAKLQRTALAEYLAHMLSWTAATLLPLAREPALYLSLLAGAAILAGAWLLSRRDGFFRIMLLYLALHACAYLWLRPIAGHDWHLYPLSLFAAVLGLSGMYLLATAPKHRVLRACGVVALLAFGTLSALRTREIATSLRDSFWTGGRDRTYQQVAGYLVAHAQPGERFASIEVGSLAYYSNLPAYDLGGLITDLRSDPMLQRNVRWLVLDASNQRYAPQMPPAFTASNGGFQVLVYHLPPSAAGAH